MARRTVTVGSSVGLHARPATLLAAHAAALGKPVRLALRGGAPVDATSALMIMTLGARHGDAVEVTGEDDEAVAVIAAMVERDLDV